MSTSTEHPESDPGRRAVLRMAGVLAAGMAVTAPRIARATTAAGRGPLKIGIIGAGRIGGTLSEHWVKAGHQVFLSSRHPENLKTLVDRLGPAARAGTPRDAAAFGDVVVIAVPYGAVPQIGRDLAAEMRGKVVLDAANPFPQRDGAAAEEARRKGTGIASAEHLAGVPLVRAREFDPGTPVFGKGLTARELRRKLGLGPD